MAPSLEMSSRHSKRKTCRLVPADEREQTLVLLVTCGTALDVSAKPGNDGVRIGARDLGFDEAVELMEAGVAPDLGLGRPEQPAQRVVGHASSLASESNRTDRRIPTNTGRAGVRAARLEAGDAASSFDAVGAVPRP